MSNNITSELELLKVLSSCKDRYRKAIISNGDKKLIQAICECIYNVLLGNVEVDNKTKEFLYKYRHCLRKICHKSSLKAKKKILIQKGGILQHILPIALPILFSLLNNETR